VSNASSPSQTAPGAAGSAQATGEQHHLALTTVNQDAACVAARLCATLILTGEESNFSAGPVRADRKANLHQQPLVPKDNALSRQQKKLLRRFARGKTDQQIAREFRCRADLIAAQRQRIMEKLEISSQAQLAAAARQFANWPQAETNADGPVSRDTGSATTTTRTITTTATGKRQGRGH
jgi:DNA-binding CsgD family transcriptional regulator